MKKYTLYIMTALALLASCTEEDIVNVTPTSGEEVKFTVGMDKAASRTLYGEMASDGKSNKVNWVNGDEITVFGTTCAVQQANYKVSTKDANGVAATDQNYASSLEKTGAAGVQWGSDNVSEFFAIYPAVEGAFSNDGSSVTVDTEIKEIQHAKFEKNDDGVWVGTPYADNVNDLGMENALMYAYKKVNYSDTKGVVDLNFKPFSTVLKFKLSGWTLKDDKGLEITLPTTEKVYINKITLYAPGETTISGPCSFTFKKNEEDKMTVIADGGSYGTITLYPDMLALLQGESVEFNVFAIPKEYTMNSSDPWVVEVETANYGIRQFSIKPTVAQTLKEGQIHNVNIPKIEFYEQFDLTEYKNEWMKYIPRNVYLSELSIPGAWYATNSDYQSTTNLSTQYKSGIRAFNIDCRMTYLDGDDESSGIDLYCAGSEKHNSTQKNDGKLVLTALTELAALLPTYDKNNPNAYNPQEYIVVVLTIAEKPKTSSGNVMGTVDPATVITKINSILKDNASALKLYTTPITANTTVADVLGKMIVKVNINSSIDTFKSFSMWNGVTTETTQYALFSEGTISSETDGNIVAGNFKTMNSNPMYWGNSLCNPALTYYYHQVQRTFSTNPYTDTSIKADEAKYLGIPTMDERKSAIEDIIDQSTTIYKNNQHNGWFQLGIGGYIMQRTYGATWTDWTKHWHDDGSEDRTTVATTLNNYVYNKITEKLNSSPSPIGMVLMNFCTNNDYKSVDLTNALITLNTKFYLNRDKTEDEWPNGNPFGGGEPQ